jgi:hypothetical protein
VSGSSICSSSFNDDDYRKFAIPHKPSFKDAINTSIKKTMKQVGYFMGLFHGVISWGYFMGLFHGVISCLTKGMINTSRETVNLLQSG